MDNPHEILGKVKQVNERATLFRITSTAMINVNNNNRHYYSLYGYVVLI